MFVFRNLSFFMRVVTLIIVMEPGRVLYAPGCNLTLASDLVKRQYGHLKKVGHACQIWSNFQHFEMQDVLDGCHPKIIFS